MVIGDCLCVVDLVSGEMLGVFVVFVYVGMVFDGCYLF